MTTPNDLPAAPNPGSCEPPNPVVHTPIFDEEGEVIAMVAGEHAPSAAASVALTALVKAARDAQALLDPDGLLGDIQRRSIDRLHKRETPECGQVGGWHLRCTRPLGHLPADIHAVANGGARWETRP